MPDISRHAVERYAERVRDSAPREDIERLLPGRRVSELAWSEMDQVDYYLLLTDDIALAIRGDVAVTCLIRSGISAHERRMRKRAKRAKQTVREKRRRRGRRSSEAVDAYKELAA